MKRPSTFLVLASATLGLAAASPTSAGNPSFDLRERAVLRTIADHLGAALRESGLPADVPISALPILGDRQDEFLGLVKIAVTKAGLNYVEGRSDPMWSAILAEIKWGDINGPDGMGFLDETTLTAFGRLQAARLLVYGRLRLETTDDGRPHAELTFHATDVETKRHLWGDSFLCEEEPPPPPPVPDGDKPGIVVEPSVYVHDPAESLLTAAVSAKTEDGLDRALAAKLVPQAEDELAERGFRVEDTPTPDILVTIAPSMHPFDRTGGHYSFRGVVPVSAKLPPLNNKRLGSEELRATGPLVLDQEPAVAALSRKLADPLRDWIAENVTAEKVGLRVQTLAVSYRGIGSDETSARIAQFCAAAAEIPGVLSCTLSERIASGNQAVYRIVSMAGSTPEGFVHRLRKQHPELKIVPVTATDEPTP